LVELPAVPITLEGSCVLHQMFHIDWASWKKLAPEARQAAAKEFSTLLAGWEHSAAYSLLGHKGDLLLLHFRSSFADLDRTQHQLAQTTLHDFLRPSNSYLSVVELGLYESSAKTYGALAQQGIEPGTAEWDAGIREVVDRQSRAMSQRLYPAIPDARYLCFYPMDRKRGEQVNWYTEPMNSRQQMMHEHGMIGRRYADQVRQIITGSIGFDDWEWGVDLFADDPLVFKKLIYEMRFDRVSAIYALFGPFFLGQRIPAASIEAWLAGQSV
jgi:peroxiredoxin